jgi:hypothetical protein
VKGREPMRCPCAFFGARPLLEQRTLLLVNDFACCVSTEYHTDSVFPTPDNITMPTLVAGQNIQHDLMGNANRTCNLEGCAGGGQVPNDAIDRRAVELNRAGLEYSPS